MLNEKAILMRFSAGVPGEIRQDRKVTSDVKQEKGLGANAGRWEKNLYPQWGLKGTKAKINQARMFHDAVTLVFDTGIGILPAPLILEYGDRMRGFAAEAKQLYETEFLAKAQHMIDWAVVEHNGTFDASNYPGCKTDEKGNVEFDAEEFRRVMREKFYFETVPLPVPESTHFTQTIASLLGTDTLSIDERVKEAEKEGQREVLRRLLAPVKHMAETLAKDNPRIFKTLTGNIQDIVKIAPALNLSGDTTIDTLIKQVSELTKYDTEELKDSKDTRAQARKAAEAMLERLSGYKL